ncbi:MAG: radical SAM protein [Candidatus Nanoarchaeia archaeon]|nr:radical SAM protein [Candidatus Nanoarchaeia archaeon]MDD5741283.1 radical SAM protein [Candidatus Nanoarchaeia archaeon]
MRFPWDKYEEVPLERRNTLQVFMTNKCNLHCEGCFARNAIKENNCDITLGEYQLVIGEFLKKGGNQINLLGGEPLLHPKLKEILQINDENKIKTTIYTNGYFIGEYKPEDIKSAKLRVSIYSYKGKTKSACSLPKTSLAFDANFMVSKDTDLDELILSANHVEKNYNCKTFFISSIRELDNPRQEFFDDTAITMPVLKYKELVHKFLEKYEGNMNIHISKRGVFESTKTLPDTKCRFANYLIGGKIIQCPYDVVNLKFQKDYEFNKRNCQQNNACLMSKIILKRKNV